MGRWILMKCSNRFHKVQVVFHKKKHEGAFVPNVPQNPLYILKRTSKNIYSNNKYIYKEIWLKLWNIGTLLSCQLLCLELGRKKMVHLEQ